MISVDPWETHALPLASNAMAFDAVEMLTVDAGVGVPLEVNWAAEKPNNVFEYAELLTHSSPVPPVPYVTVTLAVVPPVTVAGLPAMVAE
jgi:hypothetical protein